eukprot:CAMPEP_0205824682 /NCGR_PEP_ID=MMETSP0206-20130828/22167_1 /ASSEMBLY_ACC=CAM_ASM_000279 /TAXON_ID=36767 /ORGANISM="Euplotes focardii, Strain TN1" /LENGTH=413 /DNA_ID=CAMNT_0053123035 /DNA_START=19 /DNA_END=1260 /DNA_ORIENTATION=-
MKFLSLALVLVGAAAELTPDIAENRQHTVTNFTTVKSGALLASAFPKAGPTVLLWDTVLTPEKGAPQTQLFFSPSTLLSDDDVDAVTLKIWSEQDGGVQMLNAHTIRQWGFRSAMFNGDTVHVQVLATKDAGLVYVAIDGAIVTENTAPDIGSKTLCGRQDTRVRSHPKPDFRYMFSGGCSGGIISIDAEDACFMTAGHCGSAQAGRAEFNVPDSQSNGQIVSPGPEDQYPIDSSSIQFRNGGVGNDWKHMGAFPNSNTGRTAFEVQGASHPFLFNPTGIPDGNMIHEGHGVTVPRAHIHSQTAKGTPGGGTWTRSGNSLRYRFDTTGGDSGSAVRDSEGNYVGIHTHGGCRPSSPTSGNAGTWYGRQEVQDAVRSPRGICSPEGRAVSKAQRYGVHFRGDVHAFEGPKVHMG